MILKIKKTKIWYYFLSFVIVPIYDFFWKNIINFKGRILYFQWFNKKRDYLDLKKNGGVLKIEDLHLFTKVSNEVLNACTQKIITETENEINTITYDNYNQSNSAENKYMAEIFDNLDINTKKKLLILHHQNLWFPQLLNIWVFIQYYLRLSWTTKLIKTMKKKEEL